MKDLALHDEQELVEQESEHGGGQGVDEDGVRVVELEGLEEPLSQSVRSSEELRADGHEQTHRRGYAEAREKEGHRRRCVDVAEPVALGEVEGLADGLQVGGDLLRGIGRLNEKRPYGGEEHQDECHGPCRSKHQQNQREQGYRRDGPTEVHQESRTEVYLPDGADQETQRDAYRGRQRQAKDGCDQGAEDRTPVVTGLSELHRREKCLPRCRNSRSTTRPDGKQVPRRENEDCGYAACNPALSGPSAG